MNAPRWLDRKAREFDRLAPFYDALAWLASGGRVAGIYEAVALYARGARAKTAIDLCCGTGGVSRVLAQHFGRVVGVDISPGMLRIARCRAVANVEYVLADALTVRPVACPADGVTCCFGLHELPRLARRRLFRQASRLVGEQGRFVVCDYRRPSGRMGQWLARVYALYAERRHFLDYLDDDLQACGQAAGFRLLGRRLTARGLVQILVFEPTASRATPPVSVSNRVAGAFPLVAVGRPLPPKGPHLGVPAAVW